MTIKKYINHLLLPLSLTIGIISIYAYLITKHHVYWNFENVLLNVTLGSEVIVIAILLSNIKTILEYVNYKKLFLVLFSVFVAAAIVLLIILMSSWFNIDNKYLKINLLYLNAAIMLLPVCFSRNSRQLAITHITQQKCNNFLNISIWLAVVIACIAVFLPFYPGVYDSTDPSWYWYASTGLEPIYYWQAPFLQYFWRFLGLLGGIFIFNLFCYWVGLAITSYALFNNIYARIALLLGIGFFPTNVYFIYFMRVDSIVLSTLIMSIAFLLLYLFRLKKGVFLWAAVFFIFIAIGLKQDVIVYGAPFLLFLAYLITKHYSRYYTLPPLTHKKKTHVAFIFLVLLTMVYGSVVAINSQYELYRSVWWKGLLAWDMMGTSVYANKDLFYPTLLRPEYQGKVSSAELLDHIQQEFDPVRMSNVWFAKFTNQHTKDFGSLDLHDKIFVLNQLASNPVAYLFHRASVAKLMLARGPYWPAFKINGNRWNLLDVKSHDTIAMRDLVTISKAFILKSPAAWFFYAILLVLCCWTILKISPFHSLRNQRERLCILVFSVSSLLLFLALIIASQGNNFRYQLLAVYSAEISVVLLMRAAYHYYALTETRNKFKFYLYHWASFTRPRIKFLLAIVVCGTLIIMVTKHNKKVLYYHFNTLFLNNRVQRSDILQTYNKVKNNTPIYSNLGYKLFVHKNMLVYVKSPCHDNDKTTNIFVHVFPKQRYNLYLGQQFYGYDKLDFNFHNKGTLIDHGQTCLAITYLPDYRIATINTGQIDSNKNIVWQTTLSNPPIKTNLILPYAPGNIPP